MCWIRGSRQACDLYRSLTGPMMGLLQLLSHFSPRYRLGHPVLLGRTHGDTGHQVDFRVPFSQFFCHAMIPDMHGRRMCNVVDPIDIIEGISLETMHQNLYEGNLVAVGIERKTEYPNDIPQCGTDALRLALCRDINLHILCVEGYHKFCNKLWNATRFGLMKLGGDFQPRADHTVRNVLRTLDSYSCPFFRDMLKLLAPPIT
ncbi:hypothetical protein BC936DRAFT_143082 [Jimgerdemannia flammicorona]|uniref:valine--tRNA ligase n=1 Tax=Jimgerdemannia flammicorona TaxID=994334 RepID=A0A432ZZK2_9FUNG|nr:hypothetical protein BC936DRAFT_143082 [Jimgerdemannia flammicorona]